MADYLRSLGYFVKELPRDGMVIDLDLLSQYDMVIAIACWGSYSLSEIEAYKNYVSKGGALLLLTDHQGEAFHHLKVCNLPFAFGLDFKGVTIGSNVVNRFLEHSISSGVSTLPYGVGSGLISCPSDAQIIGWLSDDTFIDLNYDGVRDLGEPLGAPVLGCMSYGTGKIMFFGDVNGAIESVEQPFTDNYLNWLLSSIAPISGGAITCQVSITVYNTISENWEVQSQYFRLEYHVLTMYNFPDTISIEDTLFPGIQFYSAGVQAYGEIITYFGFKNK